MTVPSQPIDIPISTEANVDNPVTSSWGQKIFKTLTNLSEQLSDGFIPAKAHNHDNVNSAPVAGAAGGVNMIILSETNIATPNAMVQPLSRFKFTPDAALFWGLPGINGGAIRRLSSFGNRVSRLDAPLRDIGEIDDVMAGCIALDVTGDIMANDRLEAIIFKSLASNISVGTYEGDGNASQAITGLGFQPDLIFLWAEDTMAPNPEKGVQLRTKNMSGSRGSKDYIQASPTLSIPYGVMLTKQSLHRGTITEAVTL